MHEVETFLKSISGMLSAITIISMFVITLVKPIRTKFKSWIYQTAKTPEVLESIERLNKNVEDLGLKIVDIHKELKEHVVENSIDIKNSNVAQMLTMRLQLRDIYMSNYATKTLSVREHRDVHDLYDAYTALGGNGYVESIYIEMRGWAIREGR